MPTIIRKRQSLLEGIKREAYEAPIWLVRPKLWRPPTDVYESEKGVIVKVEIAGIRDEDIEVTLQGTLLLINGARSDSSERRAYHQMEIPFGKFSIDIELPSSVSTDDSHAEYKDGFLIIYFPREKLDK